MKDIRIDISLKMILQVCILDRETKIFKIVHAIFAREVHSIMTLVRRKAHSIMTLLRINKQNKMNAMSQHCQRLELNHSISNLIASQPLLFPLLFINNSTHM